MELLLSVNRTDTHPIQSQLFEGIRTLILNAGLKAGQRLPSSRGLASQLSLSRNTVSLAYERLAAEGYLKTRAKSGTYVNDRIPDTGVRRTAAEGWPQLCDALSIVRGIGS